MFPRLIERHLFYSIVVSFQKVYRLFFPTMEFSRIREHFRETYSIQNKKNKNNL